MPVKELRIEFSKKYPSTKIVGKRELLSRELEGNWTTTFKGRGLEFTGYRTYTYTDDASFIDWRASLRSKQLLVREFEEFRNFNVTFLLDVSNSMLFSSTEKFKAEFAAELVYALSRAASSAGEAVGLFMFTDKLIHTIPPGFGPGMRKRFELALSDKNNYGGVKNFKKSVLQTNSLLGPRSIVVVVSDFLGMEKNWETYLGIIAQKHDVIGIQVKDVRDQILPPSGQFQIQDPNTAQQLYVDMKLFGKEYQKQSKAHEEYVTAVFKKLGGKSLVIENGADMGKSLEKFFNSQAMKQ
jgi:uncharacterized protein (DUF58 family)